MSKKTFPTWDEYAKEAEIEPFELVISEDETLTIEAPSGNALVRIMQGLRNGDLLVILQALTGDAWPRLEELFGGVGHKVMPALTEDLMDHFDLYEEVHLVGPSGGVKKVKRPTEVQRLMALGYRPVGEAPASSH